MASLDTTAEVIVVGGGVAGCACALALAEGGLPVLLINSALDVIGLPGYGPVVEGPWRPFLAGLSSPLDEVDGSLMEAWLRWALLPTVRNADHPAGVLVSEPSEGGHPVDEGRVEEDPGFIVVDRRALSLDVKRLLEGHERIRMRQGLVVGVRAGDAEASSSVYARPPARLPVRPDHPQVEVETAFGEVFRGAACVLAVGLGLQGRVTVGEQELAGARYGEVAADRLFEDLNRQGVSFVEREATVGPRFVQRAASGDPSELEMAPRSSEAGGGSGATLSSQLAAPGSRPYALRTIERYHDSPGHAPFGPQHDPAVWEGRLAIVLGRGSSPTGLGHGKTISGLFPDGAATGEWFGAGDLGEEVVRAADLKLTRLAHTVRGQVIAGVDPSGRVLGLPGLWAAGQVAGSRGYVGSLVSGSRAARGITSAAR